MNEQDYAKPKGMDMAQKKGSSGISGESYLDMMTLIASPIPSVSSTSRWKGHSPLRCRRLLVKASGREKQRG